MSYRSVLCVADAILTALLVLTVVGLVQVYVIESVERADVLIFASVLGVPYALLRFVTRGNPVPFTALPPKKTD